MAMNIFLFAKNYANHQRRSICLPARYPGNRNARKDSSLSLVTTSKQVKTSDKTTPTANKQLALWRLVGG
jgi:hypothetical protein